MTLQSFEGALWRGNDILRPVYCQHYGRISNSHQLRATLRAGPWAWPGGYPLFLIAADGGCLCFACTRKEYRRATSDAPDWKIIACEINWENTDLACDHCSQPIQSAYGGDE